MSLFDFAPDTVRYSAPWPLGPATPGSAGLDLQASEACVIGPGCRAVVGTGLRLALSAPWFAMVCPRSGLAAEHGVTVLNAPGIIDSDYRGEVKVILQNHGPAAFRVEPGDRIAQLVLQRGSATILQPSPVPADTERGEGGLGSTGR